MVLPRCNNRSHAAEAQRSRSNHSTLRPCALTAHPHSHMASLDALASARPARPSLGGKAEPACNITGLYKCLKQQRVCALFQPQLAPAGGAPAGHRPRYTQNNSPRGKRARLFARPPPVTQGSTAKPFRLTCRVRVPAAEHAARCGNLLSSRAPPKPGPALLLGQAGSFTPKQARPPPQEPRSRTTERNGQGGVAQTRNSSRDITIPARCAGDPEGVLGRLRGAGRDGSRHTQALPWPRQWLSTLAPAHTPGAQPILA